MKITTGLFALLFFAVSSFMGGCAKPEVSPLISEFDETYYQHSYICPDGSFFLVEADGNRAQLLFGAREFSLQRTVSVSGEKYQDKRTLYWNRGDVAQFEVDGKLFLNCIGDEISTPRRLARRNGVLIRAVGQEPGWIVEISTSGTLVITDYGQNRQVLPAPAVAQVPDDESVRYQINDQPQRIELVVLKETCQDSMSGEAYPAQASLIIGDQYFNGCADIFP